MEERIENRIKEIINGDIEKDGYEIVDIKCSQFGGGTVIRVFIDKSGGVTVSDCSRVSHTIEFLLGGNGLNISRYDLEVSSPGMDRPLISERDFLRNKGRAVTVSTNSQVAGRAYFEGKIVNFENSSLILDTGTGTVNIPAGQIAKAKLRIDI